MHSHILQRFTSERINITPLLHLLFLTGNPTPPLPGGTVTYYIRPILLLAISFVVFVLNLGMRLGCCWGFWSSNPQNISEITLLVSA